VIGTRRDLGKSGKEIREAEIKGRGGTGLTVRKRSLGARVGLLVNGCARSGVAMGEEG